MAADLPASSPSAAGRLELRADCGRCFSLCCVAPGFAASAEFAISKPAGRPCPKLLASFGCSIHERLRPAGFAGCASFDCFGAGQHLAQGTFGGRDWRSHPELAEQQFAAFAVLRPLHELLWYLRAALSLPLADSLHAQLRKAFVEIERRTNCGPAELIALDVDASRLLANELLLIASSVTRSAGGQAGPELRGANLAGHDLTGADLRRASLRGALLLGTKLQRADLRLADLTGADLRGANLAGANLSTAIFVTQAQLDAASGDAGSKLPASLVRPAHWPDRVIDRPGDGASASQPDQHISRLGDAWSPDHEVEHRAG